jgi:hypothetical protein
MRTFRRLRSLVIGGVLAAGLASLAPLGVPAPAHALVVNANASVLLGELRITSADDVNDMSVRLRCSPGGQIDLDGVVADPIATCASITRITVLGSLNGNNTISFIEIAGDTRFDVTGGVFISTFNGSDYISSTRFDETISTGGGNDSVILRGNNDNLSLGNGDDSVLLIGGGVDTVDCSAGTDTVTTYAGGTPLRVQNTPDGSALWVNGGVEFDTGPQETTATATGCETVRALALNPAADIYVDVPSHATEVFVDCFNSPLHVTVRPNVGIPVTVTGGPTATCTPDKLDVQLDGRWFTQSATQVVVQDGAATALVNLVQIETVGFINPPPGRLQSLTPSRIVDTRQPGAPDKVAPNGTLVVPVGGFGGIPAIGVSAVILNVTVTDANAAGYLTVWPTGTPRPTASNINYQPGTDIPNLVTVPIGADGSVSLFTDAGAHLIVDAMGWYTDSSFFAGPLAPDGRFRGLTPTRILDTRNGIAINGPVFGQTELQVTGKGGVPATGVSAVAMTVTATGATEAGYVTVWPSGKPRPEASNLNTIPGVDTPNLVIVPVGPDGKVSLFSFRSTGLLADVVGWYTDATAPIGLDGLFIANNPTRVIDTRPGALHIGPNGPIPANSSFAFDPTSAASTAIPAGVPKVAVVANITATQAGGSGYLTAYPDGTAPPTASVVNYRAGVDVADSAIVPLNANKARIYTYADTHVLVDAVGFITG